jgi:endonuclease/exonuclease/phosphatase family metal-dependent hydrolase
MSEISCKHKDEAGNYKEGIENYRQNAGELCVILPYRMNPFQICKLQVMARNIRTFFRKFLIVANLVLAFVYLLACLAPYLNPVKWWFISWLGFVFPFLLLLLFVSVLFWFFVNPKFALLFLVILFMGWKSISVFLSFHTTQTFRYDKPEGSLRIATWNVARFIEIRRNNNSGSQTRLKMMDQLKEQNADIICMQEFYTAKRKDYYDNISYIQKNLNYPYYYFYFQEDGSNQYFSSIIFSRLPIIDSGLFIYPRPSSSEALLHVDLKFNNDTLRVFTTHLQSVHFEKKDYERIDEIKNYDEGIVSNSRTIFSKLKRGSERRSIQANSIRAQINRSRYPVIFCGDFNDIPNSYTYFTVRGNLKDAFLMKGSGIGRTFNSISPTLRIDYILASDDFSVLQFKRFVRNLSDHYMLVADLKLPGHQQ